MIKFVTIIAATFLLLIAPIRSDPDKDDHNFIGLPQNGQSWSAGQKVAFSIKVERSRDVKYFTDRGAQIFLRYAVISGQNTPSTNRPEIAVDKSQVTIVQSNSDKKVVDVNMVVPEVDKTGQYAILIKYPARRRGGKLKTIADSNGDTSKKLTGRGQVVQVLAKNDPGSSGPEAVKPAQQATA